MRASRLLNILVTLQARGRVTAQTLADECEVSLRTIYRDIDALSAAGIPVYSERGSAGGYRLLDGYRTRLNGLSRQEAEALFLSGLSRQAVDLGLGAVVGTAQSKLLTALPADLREGADRIRSRFLFDAPAWFGDDERLTQLPLVADAVWNERPLRIRYRSWTDEKDRRVEPLGIVLKSGAWYLVAQVGDSARTYRVSRIRELEPLDGRVQRPATFDLATYWRENTRRLEEELHPNRVTLRLSPWAVSMLGAALSPYVRARTVVDDEPDADGWRRATCPMGSVRQASVELLRFGAEAEVLDPPELRAHMAGIAAAMANRYGIDATTAGPPAAP